MSCATRLREILAALARLGSDVQALRRGTASLRARAADRRSSRSRSNAIEAPLPEDYVDYVTRLSAGGVGPYYGCIPVDRAARASWSPRRRRHAWKRALPLAHLGCGYAAVHRRSTVRPPDRCGSMRASSASSRRSAPSFTAFYLDWIDRRRELAVARRRSCRSGHARSRARCRAISACASSSSASPRARSTANALREALAELGPGAIEIARRSARRCSRRAIASIRVSPARALLQGLREQGLRADVVAPGLSAAPSLR